MELTKRIRDVVGSDEFKDRIEKKYGHKIVGHHQEQGIGVYELDNGDEVKYWDEKKLIGNPFGRRGKDNKVSAHFTKTKYSEWGYKSKGADQFRTNYKMKIEGAGTLAYAKSIGLTLAQIRKAENEGIGNVDDIRPALKAFADKENAPKQSKKDNRHIWEMTKDELMYLPLFAHKFGKTYGDYYDDYKAIGWTEGWQYNKKPEYVDATGYEGMLKLAKNKGLVIKDSIFETAKDMGLTDSQIKQAEREGATTIMGLRRIEKNSRGDIRSKLKVGDDSMSWGITAVRAVELGEDPEYPRSDAAVFHFDKLTTEEQQNVIRLKRIELEDAKKEQKSINVQQRESAKISRELHMRPEEMSPYPYKKKQIKDRIAGLETSIASLTLKTSKGLYDKNKYDYLAKEGESTTLQSVESSRSPLSQSSDERQEHSLVLEPDDPRVETWKRDPGRMDVRGIDTPKKKKSEHKSKREQTPTSLRRIGR